MLTTRTDAFMPLQPESFRRESIKSAVPWHVWILSDHYEPVSSATGRQRTHTGDLLYRAKYQADLTSLAVLKDETRACLISLRQFPAETDALGAITAVVAVPCNPPKPLSVPHEIAATAAVALGVPDFSPVVVKTKVTPPAKNRSPRSHSDAYAVLRPFDGERVLLIDDLFHTGTTLESVARCLRDHGAAHIVGLCLTKAHRGMTP